MQVAKVDLSMKRRPASSDR